MDKKEIEKLAELARIELTEEEKERFSEDLHSVLDYVGVLNEALKLYQAEEVEEVGELRNVLREDGEPHHSGEFSEDLLNQAPEREGDYVKVKKIL